MVGLLLKGKNEKKISTKYLFLIFFVCVSMVAWLGISELKADENDPDGNPDEYEVRYQNAAQAQRTDNVARQAALQDPEVIDLIELGVKDDATKAVYLGKVEMYTQQILDWRASGMGWGDIVHTLNNSPYNLEIHPSVLGLGHSPKSFKESVQHSKPSYKKSKSKMVEKDSGQGLALGHSKNKSSNRGGGRGGGKGNKK
jgi:hypothetical protein